MSRFTGFSQDARQAFWEEHKAMIREFLEEINTDVFGGKLKMVRIGRSDISNIPEPNLGFKEKGRIGYICVCVAPEAGQLRVVGGWPRSFDWLFWDIDPDPVSLEHALKNALTHPRYRLTDLF